MAKILLVILVTLVVVWLFRAMGRKSDHLKPPSGKKAVEDMVRCQKCGVHLPRSEALLSKGNFYCCDQHRLQDRSEQ